MSFAAAAFDFVIAHQSSTWEIEIETEIEIGNEAATVNETGAAQPHSPHPCPVMLFVSYTILTKCIFAISVRDMTATASVNGIGIETGIITETTEVTGIEAETVTVTGSGSGIEIEITKSVSET